MQTGMLGDNKVLREFWNGPLLTLIERINGPEGREELEALKRFLRKEESWPKKKTVSKRLPKSITVDLDADPFVPEGWKVEEHRRGGIVTVTQQKGELCLNGEPVELYSADGQKDGRTINGHNLWAELKDKSIVNANLLDALLLPENQHLIPKSWRRTCPFFWATRYRCSQGRAGVRYLFWYPGRWDCGILYLEIHRDRCTPAVVAASPLVP